jgi:bacteriorhodopsin
MFDQLELSAGQFDLVYNAFSFVIAAMGASLLFFLLVRERVHPKHRLAVTLSTIVVGIALYHYLRIFASWGEAFTYVDGIYVQEGAPFNEAYRYVDWFLTVPLLLAELVVVLKLAPSVTRSLLVRLSVAAVLMIGLGWPGELSPADSLERTLWGAASTVPFLYILYVLFVELGRSLARQTTTVRRAVDALRWLLLLSWGVYPLAYIAPMVMTDAATAEVIRQVGYSVADVIAKPVFGMLILAIALIKSKDEPTRQLDDLHTELEEFGEPSPPSSAAV